MDDRVEEGLGGDVFLVEEASFIGRAGGVVDADVLGYFAGGLGEEAHHAVGDDDEAVGEISDDGFSGKEGRDGGGEVGGKVACVGKGVVFEDKAGFGCAVGDGDGERRGGGGEEGLIIGRRRQIGRIS